MKLSLICLIIMFLPTAAWGDPWLIADPQDKATVREYQIDMDGHTYVAECRDLGDGTVQLWYDLAGTGNGNHIVMARAGDGFGNWSDPSVPFEFSVGKPDTPTLLRLGFGDN